MANVDNGEIRTQHKWAPNITVKFTKLKLSDVDLTFCL